jgi:hypothetical protein
MQRRSGDERSGHNHADTASTSDFNAARYFPTGQKFADVLLPVSFAERPAPSRIQSGAQMCRKAAEPLGSTRRQRIIADLAKRVIAEAAQPGRQPPG